MADFDEKDDFSRADAEGGRRRMVPAVGADPSDLATLDGDETPENMLEMREQLIRSYHGGSNSLISRVKAEGRDNLEQLVIALVEEIIKETDNLLGNGLIATEQGDLRDASVISFKRSEVIGMAIKAVQTKQQFEKEGGIDVESPSMMVVFQYFMSQVKEVFEMMELDSEFSDTFFRMLGDAMSDWKSELKTELDNINRIEG